MQIKKDYRDKNTMDDMSPSIYPPFPSKIKIDVCNACNYACVFCPTASRHKSTMLIDPSLCKRIIKDSYDAGARELGISATGEPLLNNKLEEYIAFAKNLGYHYVFINTNGFLLNKNRANSIIDSGVDSVKVSINAGIRESYTLIHGVDAFDKVISHIKYLFSIKEKCKLYLSYVAIKQTMHETDLLKKLLADFSDDIIVLNANSRGMNDIDERLLIGNDEYSFSWPCGQPFKTAVTTAEGYMLACCQDFDKMTVVADLNATSIVDAWNADLFVAFRERHLKKEFDGSLCKNCLYNLCEKIVPINADLAHYPKIEKKIHNLQQRTEKIISFNERFIAYRIVSGGEK